MSKTRKNTYLWDSIFSTNYPFIRMKSDCKKFSFFFFKLAFLTFCILPFASCDEEDQDPYIDLRIFDGSWYHQEANNSTTVVSFFRNIVYKDIMIDGEIVTHLDFGMIESVSQTIVRVNGKTCEYRFGGGKLYLKEVIVLGQPNNNAWIEFIRGESIYGD